VTTATLLQALSQAKCAKASKGQCEWVGSETLGDQASPGRLGACLRKDLVAGDPVEVGSALIG
jgi:hypothetical protein